MKAKSDSNDYELLRSMLAGEEEALALLYRRRQAGIYRFALQMCGSPGIAEDVTQEVFMFLMREGDAFDPRRGSLNSFLLGVARNYVLRRLRGEQFLSPLAEDSEEDSVIERPTGASGPLENLTRAETVETVRRAVSARVRFMWRQQRFLDVRSEQYDRDCIGRVLCCWRN